MLRAGALFWSGKVRKSRQCPLSSPNIGLFDLPAKNIFGAAFTSRGISEVGRMKSGAGPVGVKSHHPENTDGQEIVDLSG
jgi:hypothetical protein